MIIRHKALELTLSSPYNDIVVTTGTGSGKTESFLMPILGRMAAEATNKLFFKTCFKGITYLSYERTS